jgi:2-oxo-4-hydroxy-4-carboxy-5-ureidoimidazoline decarboxylase
MPQPPPVTLTVLNGMSRPAFVALLGEVFEHAAWIAETVFPLRPFASVKALHEAMMTVLAAAPSPAIAEFLNSHPDLAGPAARTGPLTVHSAREQSGAGLDRLTPDETTRLAEWNAAYRARFGFPFMICVRRHSKDSIFAEFERRLTAPVPVEHRVALDEIGHITALRLVEKVTGAGMPRVYGELSTHLLDTARGRPAADVPIELHLLSRGGPSELVAAATSDADGRAAAPLVSGRPIPNGTYELRFALGGYLSGEADAGFLDIVPVRFRTTEPEGHYHIPLLFTPWSYASYRGS